MRKILLCIFLFAITFCNAQDSRFSQFYMSPLTLNPALTGMFSGNYRAIANFRTEGQQAVLFNSIYSASFDCSVPSGERNRIGIGFFGQYETSSFFNEGSIPSQENIGVSLSYILSLTKDKTYFISGGIQAVYNDLSYAYGTLSLTSPVPFYISHNYSQSNIDGSAGVILYHVKTPRSYQYMGFSAFHSNEPGNPLAQSFSQPDPTIGLGHYTDYTIHAAAGFKMSPHFDLDPYALLIIVPNSVAPNSNIVNVGLLGRFILNTEKNIAISFGPFFNHNNGDVWIGPEFLAIESKIEFSNFAVGISDDILFIQSYYSNPSRIPEISFQYIGAFKHKSLGK